MTSHEGAEARRAREGENFGDCRSGPQGLDARAFLAPRYSSRARAFAFYRRPERRNADGGSALRLCVRLHPRLPLPLWLPRGAPTCAQRARPANVETDRGVPVLAREDRAQRNGNARAPKRQGQARQPPKFSPSRALRASAPSCEVTKTSRNAAMLFSIRHPWTSHTHVPPSADPWN